MYPHKKSRAARGLANVEAKLRTSYPIDSHALWNYRVVPHSDRCKRYEGSERVSSPIGKLNIVDFLWATASTTILAYPDMTL